MPARAGLDQLITAGGNKMVCRSAGHLWTDTCRMAPTPKAMVTFPGALGGCSGLWLVQEGSKQPYSQIAIQ